jgi:YVTN family beta-propeller protein
VSSEPGRPSGTVTFLFTDIEGSTSLLKGLGRASYGQLLTRQQELLREAFVAHGGEEIDTQGDSFFVAFRSAPDAVAAAVSIQRSLSDHEWPDGVEVLVRIGIHTGDASAAGERYVGFSVHRAARIGAAAHGGQVLLSDAARVLVEDELPQGLFLRDLGLYRLKDIDRPERISQVVAETMPVEFPPLRGAEPVVEAPIRRPSARRRLALLAGGIVLLAGAASAIVTVETTGGSSRPPLPAPGAAAADQFVGLDPRTGRISSQLPLPGAPFKMASGQLVWVGNDDSDTLTAIDPRRDTVKNLISLGSYPGAVAAGEGAAWALDPGKGLLVEVKAAYGTPVAMNHVIAGNPAADSELPPYAVYSVAAGDGSVWITDGSTKLTRVDPATLKVVARIDLHAPLDDVTTGNGGVWATSGPKAKVFRLDRHGRLTSTIAVVANPGPLSAYPLTVRVGEGYVWVLNGNTGTVTKIDPVQRTIAATTSVDISRDPKTLAVGYGACWVSNGDGTVTRVDAATNAVKVISISENVHDVAVADGTVWVTT